MMFHEAIKVRPHIVVSQKYSAGCIVVYVPHLRNFMICILDEDKINFLKGNISMVAKYINRTVDDLSETNLQFKYPTSFPTNKKGRLFYLLDDAVWGDNKLKELLLLLL